MRYDGVCVFEEAAILESHGIEVESPGGQSNSDEVDAADFPDQPLLSQACEVSLLDKRAPGRHFGFGRADLSSPTLVGRRLPPPAAGPDVLSVSLGLSIPQVPMILPSGFPLLARQRAALIGRSQACVAGSGVSWSPPSPSLQEEASAPLVEPPDSSSPEKTVAGHDSVALANQEGAASSEGTDIKTETLEDV